MRHLHNSIRGKRSGNALCSLVSSRGTLEEVQDIKDNIHDHFNEFYKEKEESRPTPKELGLKVLYSFESE